jgi:hypothetical protein
MQPISAGVVPTWAMSFRQISEQNPLAGELLSLVSCFDRQGISKELLLRAPGFRDRGHEDTTPTARRPDDAVGFEKALGVLKAFSVISEGTGECFDVYRLIQLYKEAIALLKEGRLECPLTLILMHNLGTGSDNSQIQQAEEILGQVVNLKGESLVQSIQSRCRLCKH